MKFLFATKEGKLTVKKTALKPGQRCIVNDNYELISDDVEEYKDLDKKNSPSNNCREAACSEYTY